MESMRRGEDLTRARELISMVGFQRLRQGSKELGSVLRMHQDTLGTQATRGRERAIEDRELAARIEDLDHRLADMVGDVRS